MPRPLDEFLDNFSGIISVVIVLWLILIILQWYFGVNTETRILTIGVLALLTLGFLCCAIIWLVRDHHEWQRILKIIQAELDKR